MSPSPRLPAIDIPDEDVWTFLFERKNKTFPDTKPIFVDAATGRKYTFAELKITARRFGQKLQADYNWAKGDVVCLITSNCIDMPPVAWGTVWAGGIVTPANPAYTVHELAHQLLDSGAKLLVTQLGLLDKVTEAARLAGLDKERILLLDDAKDPTSRVKHFADGEHLEGSSEAKINIDPKKDLAMLVYSSGTTGKPKGVRLSHRNLVAATLQMRASEDGLTLNGGLNDAGDRVLAVLPFFHIFGLSAVVAFAPFIGLTNVVLPRFDIDAFCSTIQKYRITFVFVAPPVALLLAKHPNVAKYDLTSVRMMTCGAAPLSKEVIEAVYNRINVPIKQGYGISEASGPAHLQPWAEWRSHIGSIGPSVSSMETKCMTIPDESSTASPVELPVGDTGEIWIRGPNIFLGYHNNPTATANSITPDGWYKTGDVGYQDAEGNFYISDRVKELIKYKGFQVAPAELEGVLTSYPKIEDAAVVGVYSEDLDTELPRAYVVPSRTWVESSNGIESFGEREEKEVHDWMKERLSYYKQLRGGIKFVTEIPKSPSGKILRRILKEQAAKEVKDEPTKRPHAGHAKL